MPPSDVCAFLDRFAPPALAADWDNVGLLLGDGAGRGPPSSDLPDGHAAGRRRGGRRAGRPDRHASPDPVPRGEATFDGFRRRPAPLAAGPGRESRSISPHTAFDNTVGGINDSLARRLGLTNVARCAARRCRRCKVVVFVPDADLAKVSDAMFAAGAGVIGQYEQCSFRLAGTGHVLRDRHDEPDGRGEGSARRCERMAARGRLPGGEPAGRAGRDAGGPFVRRTGLRRVPAEAASRPGRRGPRRELPAAIPLARPGHAT